MVRVHFEKSLDNDQSEESQGEKHLEETAASGGVHGLAAESFADQGEQFRLVRLRMDSPDRGTGSADKPGGFLLATADPLAALELQCAGVESLSHSWGPEINCRKVFHLTGTACHKALYVSIPHAQILRNPLCLWG